jgi:putative membrane protein
MLKALLISWVVLAVAIGLAAAIVPSVDVHGGVLGLLGIAVVYGLVNAIIGPVLRLVSLPATLLTFGLFALVVNAALLAITAKLTDSLDVGGFFACLVAAVLISIFATVIDGVVERSAPESAAA